MVEKLVGLKEIIEMGAEYKSPFGNATSGSTQSSGESHGVTLEELEKMYEILRNLTGLVWGEYQSPVACANKIREMIIERDERIKELKRLVIESDAALGRMYREWQEVSDRSKNVADRREVQGSGR
jgi:hypothetical protein